MRIQNSKKQEIYCQCVCVVGGGGGGGVACVKRTNRIHADSQTHKDSS